MLFGHHYTVAQAAERWGCSEEIIQALVENGTIPTHRAYLWMFGPLRLDGDYVDLVAPDARMLNKRFDEMMGGPGWQERQKQEREQTEQKIEQIKARTEEIRQEGERQRLAFYEQMSEIMDREARSLDQQVSQRKERSMQDIREAKDKE